MPMNKQFFPPRPAANPTIYAYELAGVPSHDGLLKIGYTDRDSYRHFGTKRTILYRHFETFFRDLYRHFETKFVSLRFQFKNIALCFKEVY
jgi:hypothetical protein